MTKTEKARALFRGGDIKGALRIAKSFRLGLTKEESDAITRGYECLVYPEFYTSLGKDPKKELQKGIKVFKRKIGV